MSLGIYRQAEGAAWGASADGVYAREYLAPLMTYGTQRYIANVIADVGMVRVDDVTLPITTAAYRPDNSYVCSPYNHYLVYSLEEVDKLDSPRTAAAIRAGMRPLQALFQWADFDRVVLVNNWLLSTNLWAAVSGEQIGRVLAHMREAFPERAVVFRSLDGYANGHLIAALTEAGCVPVFSRKVYYQTPAWAADTRDYRNDSKLYRKMGYTVRDALDLPASAIPRLVDLYNQLYLDKYSLLNPQFTGAFLRHVIDKRLMQVRVLVDEAGTIDAVMGYYVRRGIMTQPIFGYDRTRPRKVGLYRLLSTQVVRESAAHGLLINASAGAGQFKRLRGGRAVNEYNLVYVGHLPRRRRVVWQVLRGIGERVALPMIEAGEY